VAAEMSIVKALAGPTLPKRVSLEGLAWDDPIVSTYRDAVAAMKAKPSGDKFNWSNLAHIHGIDPNHYHFCPHGNWYFLPWHRAYLVTYEKAIRQITGHNDFAIPYWDWTTNPKLPDQFTSPTLPNNKPNALYNSDPGWQRTWPVNTPMPSNIVGPQVYQQILTTTP
jgi:tyrosinase